MPAAAARYSIVAIVLHWLIAALVIGQIALIMGVDARGPGARTFAMFHKANGIAILVLTLVRIGWRLGHKPPPLPADTPAWQAIAARMTQIGFYILLLTFPLTGWAASSMLDRPIDMWGLFNLPLMPLEGGKAGAEALMNVHRAGAKLLYLLLALHIAGALKHHVIDRNRVLASMLPIPRKDSGAARR